MITDPWIVFSRQHRWSERLEHLDRSLQSSLATVCVDHALASIPNTGKSLLSDARQALWEQGRQEWRSKLEAYADRLDESPQPGDPPMRAIDALLHAFAGNGEAEFDALEALFCAFWSLAECSCPTGGWIVQQLGSSGLMEELETQIAACRRAYNELVFQENVFRRLEGNPTPLTRQQAAILADLGPEDENTHTEFAREIFQAALENLSPTRSLEKSYLRTLIYFAEFEKGCGRSLRAARLYDQALAELETWGDEQSAAALRSHYPN
jgi:hypothetical protein